MKVLYKNPGCLYSVEAISECLKLDDFFTKEVYYYYPKLERINKDVDRDEKTNFEISKIYEKEEKTIIQKTSCFQEEWNTHEKFINDHFTNVFQFDVSKIFNDLTCNLTLCPVSPRYLEEKVFDTFYKGDQDYSIANTLHEITHYIWFHKWNQIFKDSYKDYEAPGLVWILSEAVVEQILNNKEINKINPYHKYGNAYEYFYDIKVKGKGLYYYLNIMYKENQIDQFMKKSFQFMIENEKEIRKQIG